MTAWRRCTARSVSAALVLCAEATGRSAPVKTEYVEADLVSEASSNQPGARFTLGTRLTVRPGWHVYWINPGDAGVATTIDWRLPEGFTAGAIQWPQPDRLPALGGLVTYGYSNHVMLLTDVTAPSNLRDGQTVVLRS